MKNLYYLLILMMVVACSSNKQPEYIKTSDDPLFYMSTAKPPAVCKQIGYTSGSYNTFIKTPHQGKNLHPMHINKALSIGGNYLEKDHFAGKGIVYSCPVDALNKLEQMN